MTCRVNVRHEIFHGRPRVYGDVGERPPAKVNITAHREFAVSKLGSQAPALKTVINIRGTLAGVHETFLTFKLSWTLMTIAADLLAPKPFVHANTSLDSPHRAFPRKALHRPVGGSLLCSLYIAVVVQEGASFVLTDAIGASLPTL